MAAQAGGVGGAPFSRLETLREVRVMRMRCTGAASSSTPGLPAAGFCTAAICARRVENNVISWRPPHEQLQHHLGEP